MLWAERERKAHNDRVKQAWNTAMFQRAEKPKLNNYLWLLPSEKAQSFDDQKAMLVKLSQRYGGKIRTVKLNG